ncbi:MAG: hypothetical protein WCH57_11920 [Verrucomicrobiota bacterium]
MKFPLLLSLFLAAGISSKPVWAADPACYVKADTWAETVVKTAAHIPKQNAPDLQAVRGAIRRDFSAITNSFFPKSDSFEKWITAENSDEVVAMLGKVLSSLHGERKGFEKRRDALLHAQIPPRSLDWLRLYQEAYEALRSECIARTSRIAMIRRAPNSRNGTNAIMFATHPTKDGSSIFLFDPAHPEQKAVSIFDCPEGYIFDLCPSFDGRSLLFACRQKPDDPYHVWEIGTDGHGLRQITSGPFHDFNPVYYPDGRIVFSSSRVESYSMCQNFLACALHICNPDGSNLRRIDFTTLCTIAPAVMPDGSIICTRWEYQDKNIFSWQGLWTIHPNGRQLKLYYGNTLTIPNSRYGPKPIPGTNKVMITMAAHHYPPVGDIAVVDRSQGVENPVGCQQITFETSYRVTCDRNWGPGDKFFPWAYADPWPISDDLSLVAYGGPPPEEGGPGQTRICLLTAQGVVFDLYSEPGVSFCFPVPLNSRPVPASIPGEVPTEAGEGTFFVQDVYQGLSEQGVKRGQVKELRVWQQIPKKYNTEGYRFHDHYPVVGLGSYYVKRNLGSVPVDENGSAYFAAPSNVELYFEALDSSGKEISRMGSVTQITTGENVSCIGCHENRLSPPPPARASAMARLKHPPDHLQPPPWGAGNVDYVKQVQPVLDKYCARCHSGKAPAGKIDLSGDKTRYFNMSYETLCYGGWVDYYYINQGPTGVFPAMQTGSMVSRLTKLLESKHQEVDVDPESLRRIYSWIDANVPYYGTWDMTRPHSMGGRDTWGDKKGLLPWILKIQETMAQVDPSFTADKIYMELAKPYSGSHLEINLTHPEWSRILLDHLSKSAEGTAPDDKALFKTQADPNYQTILHAIEEGKRLLDATPRMDMPGAVPIPQERNFGKVF